MKTRIKARYRLFLLAGGWYWKSNAPGLNGPYRFALDAHAVALRVCYPQWFRNEEVAA